MNKFIKNIPKFSGYFAAAFYLTAIANEFNFNNETQQLHIASCAIMWMSLVAAFVGLRSIRKPIKEYVLAYLSFALFLTGWCVELDNYEKPAYELTMVSCIIIWIGFVSLLPQMWATISPNSKVRPI